MSSRISVESQSKDGYRAIKKLSPLLIAQPYALGAGEAAKAAGAGNTSTNTSAAKEGGTHVLDYLPMDDVQDIAYTLQRIRQQDINIYVEATRKKLHHYELNITSFSSLPATPLEDQSAYLPLRKGWLVFFVATMEPLVQILNENLKRLDDKATQYDIPLQYRPQWQEHANEWKKAVHKLDDQLNICAALLDDPSPGNVKVAQSAREIDARISELDDILHQASKFLHDKVPEQ